MSDMLEAMDSPLQRRGEFWQAADKILNDGVDLAVVSPNNDLEVGYVTSAQCRPLEFMKDSKKEALSEAERALYDRTYAVAARSNTDHYHSGDPLYLIVNGNYANPLFKLEAHGDNLTLLNDDMAELQDAHLYLPAILKSIAKEQSLENDRAQRIAERAAERRKSRIHVFVGVVAVASIAASVAGGVAFYFHEKNVKAQQARDAFDATGVSIDHGTAVEPNEVSFVTSNPGFFKQDLPTPADDDSYQHPRVINLGYNQCSNLVHIDPKTDEIKVVTDASNDNIMVGIDAYGNSQVCYFGNVPRQSSSEHTPNIAVQIAPAQQK